MLYHSNDKTVSYFPPMMGNGDIVLYPDKDGTLDYVRVDFGEKSQVPDGYLFRAGRRHYMIHDHFEPCPLLSFGTFSFDCGSKTEDWTQALRETDGVMESHCAFEDGNEIFTMAVVHPQENIYAVQKRFEKACVASYTYVLKGYNKDTNDAIEHLEILPVENGVDVHFRMRGQDIYTGTLCLRMDRAADIRVAGNTVTLAASMQAGEALGFFLTLADDWMEDPAERTAAALQKIEQGGFEAVYTETVAHWNAYFENGYVKTGNEKLDGVYRTALYHLGAMTTRWSVPVGMSNCSWHGKFFAFDEYYSFLGLLGSNQTALAKRVPAFRSRVCLNKAIFRATMSKTEEQAHFCWETSEYGEELAPSGFWHDHIFHMAVIALGAFEYYEHTQDLEFLKECYRMIRACAKFYTLHLLYNDSDGSVYLGKCTDLERLGSSKERAFMTTCGVIKTLECCAKASAVLDTDEEYREECLRLADKLRESLPRLGDKYVSYHGWEEGGQKSIGMFAGKFPFDVLANDDTYMLNAWDGFIQSENKFGVMYYNVNGTRLTPWYACWKAEGFARIGNGDVAYEAVSQAFASTGAFNEMFEINEPGIVLRPWFSTASGIYLSAVNEMVLQSDGENIYLLPAYPESERDVSFRLSAKGGVIVDAVVRDGKLEDLKLTMREGLTPRTFKVYFRGELLGDLRAQG